MAEVVPPTAFTVSRRRFSLGGAQGEKGFVAPPVHIAPDHDARHSGVFRYDGVDPQPVHEALKA
jgi:hypothetical protein